MVLRSPLIGTGSYDRIITWIPPRPSGWGIYVRTLKQEDSPAMLFSSMIFLWLFLPCVLILNLILPRGAANWFLIAAGFIFYAWGEQEYIGSCSYPFWSITLVRGLWGRLENHGPNAPDTPLPSWYCSWHSTWAFWDILNILISSRAFWASCPAGSSWSPGTCFCPLEYPFIPFR